MDFARKILHNYGWKDGDGLGKNKNGIVKPLKANLKFDNAGFGADQAADDFNNHWWQRAFNEAATNINITQEGGQIKMNLKYDDSVEISTKGYSMKKLKKLKKSRGEISVSKSGYGNFLQAATLTNLGGEVENPDKIDTSFIEVSKVKVLTDEELFKACGGRTAHKGARHGLNLSGKLSRIEQQEAELLSKMMAKRSISDDKETKSKLETKKCKSGKSEKQCRERRKNTNKAVEEANELCEILHDDGDKLNKKKRNISAVASAETEEKIQKNAFIKSKKRR